MELVIWPLGGEEEGYSQEGYPRCATAAGDAAEEGKAPRAADRGAGQYCEEERPVE